MTTGSRSDLDGLLEPVANIFGWAALCFVTVFPLSGLLACVVFRNGSTYNELAGLWTSSLLVGSAVIYTVVERRRGAGIIQLAVRAVALIIVLFIGSQTVLATLFGAFDRGKQRAAMADLRQIAAAIDEYEEVQGRLPQVTSVEELSEVLGRPLPRWDPWGAEYQLTWPNATYRVVSYGSDRKPDATSPSLEGETSWRFESDIVIQGGELIRWPE